MLCFTNPRPTPASIASFYHEDYKPHHNRPTASAAHARWWARFWPFQGRRLRRTLPPHGQGRLLDFGCGEGSYLLRMKEQGWLATGLDCSFATMESLRALGIPGVFGSLPHPDLQPESFDMITMWQSLEHVHDPLEVLGAARDLLAPGGKILVACPNIESLPFRWFGSTWNALDLPRHLLHFSPTTLQAMLVRAGFRIGAVRLLRSSSWIRQSARLAQRRHPVPDRSWMRGRLGSSLASWYAHLRRKSDSMMIVADK